MSGYRTRLGLPARAGWLVREQVECVPPDGSVHVSAFSEPVQDAGTAEFASGYGQLLAEHLPGYEELDRRDVELFGGRPAVLRRYRHVPADGAPLTQIAAYLVQDGVGHVVTATASSSRFAAVEGDLLGLLAQVDLDRSAVIERPTIATAPPAAAGRREPDWATTRMAWEAAPGRARKAATADVASLSADELTALAQLAGAERFPFVDDADLADVGSESAPAVLRAARRSLASRGILTTEADGPPMVDDDVRVAVELALDPDVAITLESEGESTARAAFALDPDRAVEIGLLGGGTYRLATGSASDVVARVAALTSLTSAATRATGRATVVRAIAIDRARAFLRIGDRDGAARELAGEPELLDALATATAFNRVRTVFRSEGTVRGGELVWCQAEGGAAWLLEALDTADDSAGMLQARPIGRGDLYGELLAVLP